MKILSLQLQSAGPDATAHTKRSFEELAKTAGHEFYHVDLSTALRSAEEKGSGPGVFVVPGGGAAHMIQSFGPSTRERLTNRVHEGDRYMGFCAGAILGAQTLTVTHDVRGKRRVSNVAMLGLLPDVVAHGPAFHEAIGRPLAAQNRYKTPVIHDWNSTPIYWQHGPAFMGPNESDVDCEKIAYYQDATAIGCVAAITAESGKGIVTLSGVHPEIRDDVEDPEEKKGREKLLQALYDSVTR